MNFDPDLERNLRMLKFHDEPRSRARVVAAYGSVARAWLVLGRQLEHGLGTRTDRVSAREAYKIALKGEPSVSANAAFQLAVLLDARPELCEEYGPAGQMFGTTPAHYFREGAEQAVTAADARFRFWAPNQRSRELAAAIAPLIARRRNDVAFGDPDAMYERSQLLTEGFGVPRHRADAAAWLHRAAAAGHLGAACRLRTANWQDIARLAVGTLQPRDYAPALGAGLPLRADPTLDAGATGGPGDAPELGGGAASPFQLLRVGLPSPLPVRWPAAAAPPLADDPSGAEAGDVEAQLRLGAAEEDPDKASFWLLLAAAYGHPSAFRLLDALPPAPDAEARAALWWERRWG
jgi:TPR repeat protein